MSARNGMNQLFSIHKDVWRQPSDVEQVTEMIENKVPEMTGRSLINLSSITDIIDEETITLMIEEILR